jgi:hypothetical protein
VKRIDTSFDRRASSTSKTGMRSVRHRTFAHVTGPSLAPTYHPVERAPCAAFFQRVREQIVLRIRSAGINFFPLTDSVLPANIRVDLSVSTSQNTKNNAARHVKRGLTLLRQLTLIEGEEMMSLSQDVSVKKAAAVQKASPPSPVFWKPEPLVTAPPPPSEAKLPMPDLRDFFAAAALQGLLSRDAGRNVSTIADYESKRALTAYRLADEMLKAR